MQHRPMFSTWPAHCLLRKLVILAAVLARTMAGTCDDFDEASFLQLQQSSVQERGPTSLSDRHFSRKVVELAEDSWNASGFQVAGGSDELRSQGKFAQTTVAEPWEKWVGSVEYEGKIYGAPVKAEGIFIFDPESGTLSSASTSHLQGGGKGGFKWSTAIACQGKIYSPPLNANSILVYDPVTSQASQILLGSHWDFASVPLYYGMVAIGNKIYAGPLSAEEVLVYDIEKEVLSGVSTKSVATGPLKWHGIAEDGGTIYGVPHMAENIMIYDTTSGSVSGLSTSHVATGPLKWVGLTKLGRKLYGAPGATSQIFVFDLDTQNAFGIPVAATGTDNWCDLISLNGLLYAPPYNNENLLALNPVTNQVSYVKIGAEKAKYCATATYKNRLYLLPDAVNDMLVLDTSTNETLHVPTDSLEVNGVA